MSPRSLKARRSGDIAAGEVLPLKETGVTELYFSNLRQGQRNGFIVARRGYKRVTADGKTEVGKSVDWFARSVK